MTGRHVGIDKSLDGKDYEIRFWENGELMYILHTKSVGYYTLTITDWLDGANFRNF